MKILEVLTYYRPHVSGLTIYVERLSRALVRQGHEVTVLTSQYDKRLPRREVIGGVTIVRVPVAFHLSKGVIMPTFGWHATRLTRQTEIMHLHLPQFDAPGLALRGRLFRKPVALTYHCDLRLPDGALNRVVDNVVKGANRLAGTLAGAVVTYTRDYASHSPFLTPYLGRKLAIIAPPVELVPCTLEEVAQFRARHKLAGRQVIGISARLASEKGIEVLLNALPIVLAKFPAAKVLHAAPQAIGEAEYVERLRPLFAKYKASYAILGTLNGSELTAFYKNLDCLVVSSLNSTESFGLVQIEAMMNDVPVIASDLPGVRQPVTMTGMGEVTPIGDAAALGQALIRVLSNKARYLRSAEAIAASFSPDQTAAEYMKLFERMQNDQWNGQATEPEAYEALRQSAAAAGARPAARRDSSEERAPQSS